MAQSRPYWGALFMADLYLSRDAEPVIAYELLGTLPGNTADLAGNAWTNFPTQLEGPFGNEVIIRITGIYGVNLNYISYFLLQLILETTNGPALISPASRVYPTLEPQLIPIQIPELAGILGWNRATLQLKGRRFNNARYAAVGNDWRVTAEYAIVKDRLLPTLPRLIRYGGERLLDLVLNGSGQLIAPPALPPAVP